MHLRGRLAVSHLAAASPPPPPTSTTNLYANGIIQMVSTALIILMTAIFITSAIFFCFFRSAANGCCGADGGREQDDHHDGGGGGEGRRRRTPAGISRAVIETFPTYLYSDVRVHRLGNGELECAVCLNEFKDVEILRLLPTCCHVFHPDCIDTWLTSRPTCPVCRADVGSISNLTEHGDLRNILGTSSDGDDHSSEEQANVVQIRIATPEAMRTTRLQESHPKSHSTGHSPAWITEETNRFTLRLPEEVRNKLASGGRWQPRGGALALMSSPRSWYRQRNNKQSYHRFRAGNMLDRLGKPVEPSNVVGFGSPKSDGPVDYSTLVNNNGRNNMV